MFRVGHACLSGMRTRHIADKTYLNRVTLLRRGGLAAPRHQGQSDSKILGCTAAATALGREGRSALRVTSPFEAAAWWDMAKPTGQRLRSPAAVGLDPPPVERCACQQGVRCSKMPTSLALAARGVCDTIPPNEQKKIRCFPDGGGGKYALIYNP